MDRRICDSWVGDSVTYFAIEEANRRMDRPRGGRLQSQIEACKARLYTGGDIRLTCDKVRCSPEGTSKKVQLIRVSTNIPKCAKPYPPCCCANAAT